MCVAMNLRSPRGCRDGHAVKYQLPMTDRRRRVADLRSGRKDLWFRDSRCGGDAMLAGTLAAMYCAVSPSTRSGSDLDVERIGCPDRPPWQSIPGADTGLPAPGRGT